MKIIKTAVIAIAALGGAISFRCLAAGEQEQTIVEIRSAISNYVATTLSGDALRWEYIANFGLPSWHTSLHTNLALVVSNKLDSVFAEFSNCATNQLEKYVLVSAGWQFSGEYFTLFLDKLLDQAALGTVGNQEIVWYMGMHLSDDSKFSYILSHKDEPVVSNVVNKLESVAGMTNYCNKIRSGEALREHLEFTEETSD